MLTEPKYLLDLESEQNSISRNSACQTGGKKLEIFLTNPRDEFIIGVDLTLTPYLPNQSFGKRQFLKQIRIQEDFEKFAALPGMNLTIPVIPEYSYLISASFRAEFGSLTPSMNTSIPGEFESLMKKVGCSVKNNFYFKDKTKWEFENLTDSLIACASACFNNDSCIDAWSYEYATRKCFFYGKLSIIKLQPASSLLDVEQTLGWATGLKSCSEEGKIFHSHVKLDENNLYCRYQWRLECLGRKI